MNLLQLHHCFGYPVASLPPENLTIPHPLWNGGRLSLRSLYDVTQRVTISVKKKTHKSSVHVIVRNEGTGLILRFRFPSTEHPTSVESVWEIMARTPDCGFYRLAEGELPALSRYDDEALLSELNRRQSMRLGPIERGHSANVVPFVARVVA